MAELRLKQLRLNESEQLYRKALQVSTKPEGSLLAIGGMALLGLGEIALERFDLEEAEVLLQEGLELAQRWSLISTMTGHYSMAILHDLKGRNDLAEESLSTLWDVCRRFDIPEADDIIAEILEARMHLQRGSLGTLDQWIVARGLEQAPARKPPEFGSDYLTSRVYKYQLSLVARWHMAHGRDNEAIKAIEEMYRLAKEAGRPYLQIEAEILRARIFAGAGAEEKALLALRRALEIAAPVKLRRIFLSEGQDVIGLLKRGKSIWKERDLAEFVDDLLTRVKPVRTGAALGPEDSVEQLSPREMDVLRLLPSGLSTEELAKELFISANTVRSHLKSIYAKLDVHSRHEAVVEAIQRQLL